VAGFYLKWFFETDAVAPGFRIAIAVVIVGFLILLAAVGWNRGEGGIRPRSI
jgi:hypothetical protein